MRSEDEIKTLLNTGKWAYTIIDNEIYFKYLGNKDRTDLGYILHFDWPESKEQPMNEIEKMCILAGIRKGRMSDEDCAEYCLDYECKNCRYNNYPPFTAEKLINLEMFLINKGDFDIKKGSKDITFESFTSCISGLINNIWQDLSEEEKQQVKGILE